MFEMRITALLFALLLLSTTVDAQVTIDPNLIPANRVTMWKPGVTNNGGIPNRTTIYKTLSPSGGDDTAAIQAALDGCPPNQVVQLTAGVFKINAPGLNFASPTSQPSGCTLRGVGPGRGLSTGINAVNPGNVHTGTFIPDPTATQLIKADRATDSSVGILSVGNNMAAFSTSINLASDAAQGTNSLTLVSNPGIQVGEIVLVDQITDNDPDVHWGPAIDSTPGSKCWFVRCDRSLNQIMEVTAVNGNTITFATPFHITFKSASAYTAQLSRYATPVMRGIGIENIFFYGGMVGNVGMSLCAYCWIKNIESFWSNGGGVALYANYRSELRDSFIHETPDPNPGGGGYLVFLSWGSSDNLIENNIMWYGNKEIAVDGAGGGNVIAYNYMDDSFGANYPDGPEAGLNAAHYTTTHMELLEGNYSQNYLGDSFWGPSIYITVFRNHLSALRAAAPPLNNYQSGSGCGIPYGDFQGRFAVDVQAYSYYTNFVGNVLGLPGQTLLSAACYPDVENRFVYEILDALPSDNPVVMWYIGSYQATTVAPPFGTGQWTWQQDTIKTQLRNGNWDFVTGTQIWYANIGDTGTTSTGQPQTIPNSLYLSSKPAFFGSSPWPWVDPSTGTVHTLPAKERFYALIRGIKKTANTHDFNADGNSSVLWKDSSGNAAMWRMSSAQITQFVGLGNATPSVWSIVAQRDFNGDGKSDILWQDTSGNVWMWLMNDAQVAQSLAVGNAPPSVWSIVAAGDFDGDGKSDILWQDTSGNVAIWFMNGPQITQFAGVGNAPRNVWKVVGTGDFNGDGKSDILWQDTSGNVAIWFMNGAQMTFGAAGNAPLSVWSIAGIGDFDGDGKSDILWQDKNGNVAIWFMSGSQITQFAGLGQVSSLWSIVGTGDFNGDGKSDILWQDKNGNVEIWFMNGAQIIGSAGVGNAAPTLWKIQGANAD